MNEVLGSTRRRKRNSGRVEWCTPLCVLNCVEAIDTIMLDPCWSPRSRVQADERLSVEGGNDGLAYPWHSLGSGLVYVNPPYGAALKQWVPKIIAEAEAGCEIVALLPNSTESAWFVQMHDACDAAVAWRGRLTVSGALSPAFFGSVLFYFGERRKRFLEAFSGRAYSIRPEAHA
jgi:hypothetical protein